MRYLEFMTTDSRFKIEYKSNCNKGGFMIIMSNETVKKNIENIINPVPDHIFIDGKEGKQELIEYVINALIPHKTVYVCELSKEQFIDFAGNTHKTLNETDIMSLFKRKEIEVKDV